MCRAACSLDMLNWQRQTIDDAARAAGRDPSAIHAYVRVNVAEGTPVDKVADAVQVLADNGYPDAFVDLMYVADRDRRPPRVGGTAAGPVSNGLLEALRVLDLGGAESDAVSRLFADLGADVLKIEPPAGSPARRALPSVAGASIPFALHNANKRSAVLDPDSAADRDRLIELAGAADIVVDGGNPPGAAAFGTSCAALAEQFGHLVALSVTDFGTTGPYASWRATDPVLYAMSTALSRTGPTAGTPVLPPAGVASATAAVQAAWAALAAYYHRLRCGTGEYIDFSRFEAVVQSLDPPFGSEGQAAVGLKRSSELWRGRPRNQQIYPIFPCKDGYVRICLLSARQWRGMCAWLGEPEQFADPKFDTHRGAIRRVTRTQRRHRRARSPRRRWTTWWPRVNVAEFRSRRCSRRRRRCPRSIFALSGRWPTSKSPLAPACPFPSGRSWSTVSMPGTPVPRHRSARTKPPGRQDVPSPRRQAARAGRPFDGMRILDLGVIVAGGELGRLFADLGAEVIKIESAAYPDGLRQTPPGQVMSRSWALTHRNEYGLGLDLRHPSGADAIRADWSPAPTRCSPTSSRERLRRWGFPTNGCGSSTRASCSPRAARSGPPARGARGWATARWSAPPPASPGCGPPRTPSGAASMTPPRSSPITSSARITAIATLAAVIGRDRTGTGAHVHISQAEAAVNQLATAYVAEAARAARLPVADDPAVHAVYPCDGDDEWCVISLRSRRRPGCAGRGDGPRRTSA